MAASLTSQLSPLFRAGQQLGTGQFSVFVHRKAGPKIKRFALIQTAKVLGADQSMRNFPRPSRRVPLKVNYSIKQKDLLIRFLPAGMAKIVFEGNKYGGGPSNPAPFLRTVDEAPELWQDALAREWARRVS